VPDALAQRLPVDLGVQLVVSGLPTVPNTSSKTFQTSRRKPPGRLCRSSRVRLAREPPDQASISSFTLLSRSLTTEPR
jgi:hypothetical protein